MKQKSALCAGLLTPHLKRPKDSRMLETCGQRFRPGQETRPELGREIRPEHLNTSASTADYPDFYTPETRDMVAEVYRRDIDMFGYEFAR